MEEQTAIERRRRGDGGKQALNRIKAHRLVGRRSESGFQIRQEEPIYDTVTEDEYKALVAKRQAEDPGFIVDDEGNGYGDQGEEEDWSRPPSSDESETELEKRKKKRLKTDKKEIPPAKLSQRISSMFTSSVFRKPKDDKVRILSSDSIIDDVIAEFAPDETDREKRRKVHTKSSLASSIAQIEDKCLVRKCDLVPITENREEFSTEVARENVIEEKVNNYIQTDPVEKKIQGFTLNAKLREETEPTPSAGWQAGISVGHGSFESNLPVPKSDFVSNSDGPLSFYIIDAQQDSYGVNSGNIFLFGKVKAGNTYQSCCVVVKNMQRCVYAIPESSVFNNNSIMELERQVEESKISTADFHAKLHEMASGMKRDLAKGLLDRNVSGFCMKHVKRNYAFERLDIPHGENYVLKLTYPFKDPPLPQDLKGFTRNSYKASWCKTEIIVDCPKDIHVISSPKNIEEIPPVVATAINLKTAISKKHVNEIVSASVICCHEAKGNGSSSSSGIAQRARHPDDLTEGNVKWMIDIDYYLAQQIHPVVSRLCASIEGTSPARLADCLGLDSSKFQSKSTEAVVSELGTSLLSGLDADERYRGCEPLFILCPNCSGTFDCPTLTSSISSSINEKSTDMQDGVSTSNFWCKLRCPKCPDENESARLSSALIANQVKRQAEGFISRYYKGIMTCEDETCKYTTRSLNLRVLGDSERGTICPNYPRCNGRLVRQYTEGDLYKQLSYLCYVLDTVQCTDKIKGNAKVAVEKEVARIKPVVELAAKTVQKIRDRCSYGWVKLNDLIFTI